MTSRRRGGGFTLLEVTVTLAIIGLAASLVLPRLRDARLLALDAAADRLAAGLAYGRERAILTGEPMRLVLDLDVGRWQLGRPAREATALRPGGSSELERPTVLATRVRLRAVAIGGTPMVFAGRVALELDPAGDPLPAVIELADEDGRVTRVSLPPATARPTITRSDAG